MKTVAASGFSARVDRFMRWFFSASPDAFVAPARTKPPGGSVARGKRTRRQPLQTGPVLVAAKAKR